MIFIVVRFFLYTRNIHLVEFVIGELSKVDSVYLKRRYKCIVNWVYIYVRNDINPENMLKLYKEVLYKVEIKRIDVLVAIVESAIWLNEKKIVEELLDKYCKDVTDACKRLEMLNDWRFNKSVDNKLMELLTNREWFLPYLDVYVKATIYFSREDYDNAKDWLYKSLKLLPANSNEYTKVYNMYNLILEKEKR